MSGLEPGAASVEELLGRLLAAGTFCFGEIRVVPGEGGGCELRHRMDADQAASELSGYQHPEDAAEIARYTDAGFYRPLKTAPNLRRGWLLPVDRPGGLRLALDLFYPGRLGALLAFGAGRLEVTNFHETLARQSGMYRVTQKLTEDQADALIGRFCRSDGGCLRTIIWPRDAAGTHPSSLLPASKYDAAAEPLPLFCQEACNLLVAEARQVVKGEIAP